jgi:hypothetical protein
MPNTRNTPYDNLLNEIAREKFSALKRITEHLSSSLQDLEDLDGKIEEAMKNHISLQEINKMIDRFNLLCEDAEEWKHYLVVTREASGFFHSNLGAGIYRVPSRKSKLR